MEERYIESEEDFEAYEDSLYVNCIFEVLDPDFFQVCVKDQDIMKKLLLNELAWFVALELEWKNNYVVDFAIMAQE